MFTGGNNKSPWPPSSLWSHGNGDGIVTQPSAVVAYNNSNNNNNNNNNNVTNRDVSQQQSHSRNLHEVVVVGPFDVAVFWDYENVPIPAWCSGHRASDAIRSNVIPFGRIVDRKLYYDSSKHSDRTSFARSELDSSGFTLVDCPSRNTKETLDKKLIVDVLFFAWERASRGAKACVVLITSDGDYSYTLARLRDIGVFTVIIYRPDVVAKILIDNANVVMSWEYDVLGGHVEIPALVVERLEPNNKGGSIISSGTNNQSNAEMPILIENIESSGPNSINNDMEIPVLAEDLESRGSIASSNNNNNNTNLEATLPDQTGLMAVFLKCVLFSQRSRLVHSGGKLHEVWGLDGCVAVEFYKTSGSNDKEIYRNLKQEALQQKLVELGRRLLSGQQPVVKCNGYNLEGKSLETFLRLTQLGFHFIRVSSTG